MTIVRLTLTENFVCYAYITTVYPIALIFLNHSSRYDLNTEIEICSESNLLSH